MLNRPWVCTQCSVGLTEPQQNRRYLPERPTWSSQPVLGLRPAYPGTVQPGVDVVPAQCFGLGHQLLVGGRAVEHFSREHRGAAQHLHAAVRSSAAGCAALSSPPAPPRTAVTSLCLRAPPLEIILHKQSLGLDGCHLFNSLDKSVDAKHPRQGGEEMEDSASLTRR